MDGTDDTNPSNISGVPGTSDTDTVDRAIASLISAVNKHLPRNSRMLSEMLEEEYPTIMARDGNEYVIEKKELEFIAEYLDEEEVRSFPIPIVLEMCEVKGKRLVYVRNKKHAEFLKRAFGFDRFVDGVLVLDVHEIHPVRRKLKTASQIMFNVID